MTLCAVVAVVSTAFAGFFFAVIMELRSMKLVHLGQVFTLKPFLMILQCRMLSGRNIAHRNVQY